MVGQSVADMIIKLRRESFADGEEAVIVPEIDQLILIDRQVLTPYNCVMYGHYTCFGHCSFSAYASSLHMTRVMFAAIM